MPEPQGARIPAPRVHPPHAAKAMSNQQMIPDGLSDLGRGHRRGRSGIAVSVPGLIACIVAATLHQVDGAHRRHVLAGLVLATGPGRTAAQPASKVYRVGLLTPTAPLADTSPFGAPLV